MNMPEISIVMPVYNVEKYIDKAIKSVLAQTYSDFELIIVNDGTEDSSMKCAERHAEKDSRISILEQTNRGLSSARNTGLKYASGKYICFMDSDDEVDSCFLKTVMTVIEEKEPDVLMFGMIIQKLNNKEKITQFFELKTNIREYNRDNLSEFNLCDEAVELIGYATNKIYKRNLLMDHDLYFDEDILFLEDINFNEKVFQFIQSFIVISQCLYYYKRRNRNSLIKTFHENHFELQMAGIDSRKKILENWRIDVNLIEASIARLHFRAIRGSCSNLFHNINNLSFQDKRQIVYYMLHYPHTISRIEKFDASSLYEMMLKLIIRKRQSWTLSYISNLYALQKKCFEQLRVSSKE